MNAQNILAASQPQSAPTQSKDGNAYTGIDQSTQTQQGGDFDAKFKTLAAMERKMREKEMGFSQKEKEWEEKSKKMQEMEELMALLDENPIEAIKKKKGWGLQELNEFAVKNSTDEDLDPVAQITKNYEKRMEEMKKQLMEEFDTKIKTKEDEYAKKDQDYQINQFKGNIKSFLSENKNEYELTSSLSMEEDETTGDELIYNVIYEDVMRRKAAGEEDLSPLSFKDAADKVEAYLDSRMQKYLKLNKVRSKFSGDKDNLDLSTLIAQSNQNLNPSQPRTLNNQFAPKSQSLDQLSPEERKKQAEDLVRSWIR
jgi:hypothetical protein